MIHYYSLVLKRERAMQMTAIKRMDLERHWLLIKLDAASKKMLHMPNYITHGLVHKKD